jgi:outer membrane protein OmpA-like peptidoglycan-associated protein
MLAIALLGTAAAASAQRALDVQIFAPPAGHTAALTIPEPELPAHGTFVLGTSASYARWPLVRKAACDAGATTIDSSCVTGDRDGRTPVVSDLVQVEASLALALYDALQLGIVLPVALSRVADDVAAPQRLSNRVGLSDVRLSTLVPLVAGGTALAFSFVATLPTGDKQSLIGARNWTATPTLVLRQRIDKGALSLALGYRLRERDVLLGLEHDDELDAALGAAWPLLRELDLRAELRARLGVGGETWKANENPLEGDLAAALRVGPSLWLMLGGGAGLWPGREGYGAPVFRLLASLRYTFEPAPCAFGPEDFDGYRDDDACRDPDNDGDGIDDDADACPNDAEDRDGFADGDGCPDLDDDADGLPDALDRCPRQAEDRDGFEDEDGCPEPDNDEDGIADADDACPMDPEDRDGFEDDDGCPEPGPEPTAITVSEGRILVSDRIYFDYDRDTIRAVSTPVLDQLAQVIRGLAAGLRVVVEGYTDDSGNAAYNLDLSHRRARAVVEYLRARGVPAARLDFVGYGASHALGPNDTAEGRALNRRVEFLLVR